MEVTLASILNLASLGGLAYLSSCLKKERLKLSEIESAKVYSPTRLLNSLLKTEFLQRLTKNADNPDEYTLKAFIEGYVDSNRPIQSIIDGKTKLVHSLFFKDEIYSNDPFSKGRDLNFPTDEAKEVRAPLLFWLRDPNKDNSCLVHRNLAVDATSALEKIAESREYKHLNCFEKILVYLGLFIELASLVTKTTYMYKGVKIGWTKNEYGIMLGTALTVYGEVIYNLKDKSLRIDTPQYFLHDKSNIVKKVRENIYGIQGKMMLLLIPLILSWIYLAKKAINYYRKLRRKRLEKRFDKLWKVKSVKMKDDYRCVVCFEKPRNIIAKPCLHFSLCGECYSRLDKKICPICKKSISDVVEVFFS